MVTILPAEIAPAPTPRGLRYGLFAAAVGPIDLTMRQQAGGLKYQPVSCGTARVYPVECVDLPDEFDQTDDADPWIEVLPFLVYSTYPCRPVGTNLAELEGKVRTRLANSEQATVEGELSAALAAAATPLTAPDPSSITSVIGELEQWLYGSAGLGYGHVGVLHAPVRFAAAAGFGGGLVKDGPLWRTHAGTVWSFGDYADDGRIYITGTAAVWRNPEVVVPDPQLDRENNEYRLVAQREYAFAYDCGAASAVYDPDLVAS